MMKEVRNGQKEGMKKLRIVNYTFAHSANNRMFTLSR
jgi:hypothetical protein